MARALSLIIEEAVKAQASEIQLKPQEDRLLTQFRIGGALQDVLSLPLMTAAPLIARIKILANLSIADHRPQEGLFRVRVEVINQNVECKVAITSTKYGEMVILNLATEASSNVSIDIEKQVADLLSKIV